MKQTFAIAIGGAAGQGVATPGDIFAKTTANFRPFAWPLPLTGNRYAVLSGNTAMAMGGAAAGVKRRE